MIRKLPLLLILLHALCFAQTGNIKPVAMTAVGPDGSAKFLQVDGNGNLYTGGAPASMGGPQGYIPPVAATALAPDGSFQYIKLDDNGNLLISGGVTTFAGVPTGTCTANQLAVDSTTGLLYSCNGTAWQLVSGGGGNTTSTGLVNGVLPVATGAATLGTSGIASANVALKNGNLGQFAATTSAQLAGVISDETGSGAAVFGSSPTLVSPTINTPTISTPTITGHATIEGATLTGVTGTGKLVLDTAPTFAGLSVTSGTLDLSSAAHTLLARKGLAGSIPATCTVGEEYFATDATAGSNKYLCTSTNTWTQQQGAGGGGNTNSSSMVSNNLPVATGPNSLGDSGVQVLNGNLIGLPCTPYSNGPTAGVAYLECDSTSNTMIAKNSSGTVIPFSLPATVVQTGQANTYSAFNQDFTSATVKLPSAASCTATSTNQICIDTTSHVVHFWNGTADVQLGSGTVNTGVGGQLAYYATSTNAVSAMGAAFTYGSNVLTVSSAGTLDISAGAIILNSIANKTRNAFLSADVSLCHSGGGCQTFQESSDGDTPRGQAVIDAWTAGVDGDVLVVAPQAAGKIYDLGNNTIDLSKGNTITMHLLCPFCGLDQATIKCSYASGNGRGCVTPGKMKSYVGYVTIWGYTADDTVQQNWVEPFGIGVTDASDGPGPLQPQDAVCDHCHIKGTNDALIWFSAKTAGISFYDSWLDSTYDQVSFGIPNGTGSNNATGYIRLYNTRITCTADTWSQCNAIKGVNSDSVAHPEFVVDVVGTTIQAKGTMNLTNIINAYGYTVNLRSGGIDTSGASGTFKHLLQTSSGVMNISAGFIYDPTKTSGTLTYPGTPALLVQLGIPASANGLATDANRNPAAQTAHNVSAELACSDSSGSGTAQSCSTSPTFTPAAGDMLLYKTTTANTGDVTINVNSTSAIHVRKWLGAATLAAGDLPANVTVPLVYDGTYWEIATIGNAPTGGGSGCIPGGSAGQMLTDSGSGGCNSSAAFVLTSNTLATSASGVLDLHLSPVLTGLRVPEGALASPTAKGNIAFDTSTIGLVWGNGSTTNHAAFVTGSVPAAGVAHFAGGTYALTSSAVALSELATQAADTLVMNASGSTAAPTAVSAPSGGTNGCAGSTEAANYSTSTHAWGCITSLAKTGVDINTSNQVTATHLASPLPAAQGGTGQNFGASTGVVQVLSGTMSASTALANGTTATTGTAWTGGTNVATQAYAESLRKPAYTASGTAVSQSVTVNTVLVGPTTLFTPDSNHLYSVYGYIWPSAVGSGGACNAGAVAYSLGWKDPHSTTTISVGTGSTTYQNLPGTALNNGIPTSSFAWNSAIGTVNQLWTPQARMLSVGSGTAVQFQIWQTAASTCTTTQQQFDWEIDIYDEGH